jgi:uncharacterized membrane protein YcaP (DUF421 family)
MDIAIRATIVFFLLLIALRAMGQRELADMTPFEFIMAIVIGDLIQQAITQNDFSVTGGVLAVGTILFWTLAMSWVSYFSQPAAKLLEGEPRVVVKDGSVIIRNARALRLSRREVESGMRGDNIGAMDEIALAVLEPHGRMSFIKKRSEDD